MIDLLNIPDAPTFTEDELSAIRSAQDRALWALVDQLKLEGGIKTARARFQQDIPPVNHLKPSTNPDGWYISPTRTEALKTVDERMENASRHYFDEPAAKGMPDPLLYGVSQMMMDVTSAWLKQSGRMAGPMPIVASLNRGDIRAYIRPSPSGNRNLMFYPSGLYLYLGDLAKALAHLFYPISPQSEGSERTLAEAVRLVPHMRGHAKIISQAVTNIAAADHPMAMPRVQIAQPQRYVAATLHSLSQMFLFAHEIAHQELGHFDEDDQSPERKIAQEYEADRYAMETVCAFTAKTRGSWALGFWGCQLLLLSFQLLDRALLCLDKRRPDAPWKGRYYPHPDDRRRAIQRAAKDLASPEAYAAAAHITDTTVDVLNRHQYDIDLELFAIAAILGKGPSPIWQAHITQQFGPKERPSD